MSNQQKTRRYLEAVYHQRYKPLPNARKNFCAYCGLPAVCIDHCPALSSVLAVGTQYCEDNNIPLHLVPACTECNGLIGSKILWTFEDRKQFVARRLKSRYKKISSLPPWSDDEIEQMGRGLKSMVRAKEDLRQVTVRRIAFAEDTYSFSNHLDPEEAAPA